MLILTRASGKIIALFLKKRRWLKKSGVLCRRKIPLPTHTHTTSHMTSSLQVFRRFFKILPNGDLDASEVISLDCYNAWLESRTTRMSATPEKAFHRAVSAHISGTDGRSPFTPQEEAALLKVVRRKERWPCFLNSKVKRGEMGFRAQGIHERQAQEQECEQNAKRIRVVAPPPQQQRTSGALAKVHLFTKSLQPSNNNATTQQRQQLLLQQVSLSFPHQSILIFDFTSVQDYTKCIVLQNQISKEVFGPIASEYGGTSVLFREEDVQHINTCFQSAYLLSTTLSSSSSCYMCKFAMQSKFQEWQEFNVFLLYDRDTTLWALVGHASATEDEE